MFAHADQLGLDTVKSLLNGELQPEINTQDYVYSPALIGAIVNPSKYRAEFVDMLLEAEADPNICTPDGSGPLFVACTALEDPDVIKHIIRSLLKAGADVNMLDYYGNTALMWYVKYNTDTEIAKILIEAGTDINVVGVDGSALELCCNSGIAEFEGKLVKKKMFEIYNFQRESEYEEPDAKTIDIDLLNLLIASKANVNSRSPESPLITFCWGLLNRPATFDTSAVQILIDAKANVNAISDDETALHYVVRSKHQCKLQIVQSLLDAGAARSLRDASMDSPLIVAIKAAKDETLDLDLVRLLARAEDVASDHIKCRINKERKPLLIKAIKSNLANKLDVIRELLDANMCVNVVDKSNKSAVMVAIRECKTDPHGTTSLPLIQLLIERGASVNAVVPHASSPLILAIKNYYMDYIQQVLKLLLDAGADPNYMDKDRHTALYFAMRIIVIDDVYIEYIRYLLEARAHIYFDVDDIGQANCLQMYLAGYQLTSSQSDYPKLDRICKVYELFKIYHKSLRINRHEINRVIMKRVVQIDKEFDRWQVIMTETVQPLIQVEAGKIILKPDSHRIKLMACKYSTHSIEHLTDSVRAYYSIHDDSSLRARLSDLDTA